VPGRSVLSEQSASIGMRHDGGNSTGPRALLASGAIRALPGARTTAGSETATTRTGVE